MSIEHAVWLVGEHPTPLPTSRLPSEQLLESMIVREPAILSQDWMLIGRQENTGYGGRIDLLALSPDGSLVLIEIKRDRTPREVVAQALDYASWVDDLRQDQIVDIYQRFKPGGHLQGDFYVKFGTALDEETLNASHQIIVVAAQLDPSSERIVDYLNRRGVAVNVAFFQVFQHGEQQFLSRAWLVDPVRVQAQAASSGHAGSQKEAWNGEFYVSFGDETARDWDDARRYGYISAGGGAWYSRTLKLLSPGDRIWVKIPQRGFVGVGRVLERVQPVTSFTVPTETGDRLAMDAVSNGGDYRQTADDAERAERFVRVQWLDTLPAAQAFNEAGLFGNQNTVCQPTTPKWRHTVDRLKTVFTQGVDAAEGA